MPLHVVLTTIRTPHLLRMYVEGYGGDSATFHVVGDHKTPEDVSAKFLPSLGVSAERLRYYSPDWMAAHGYEPVLRWNENHDSLRVVGFLEAVKAGAAIIVTIDDDNEPKTGLLAKYVELFSREHTLSCASGWVDPLATSGSYARGFPYMHRQGSRGQITDKVSGRIAFHQGLTSGAPDIDALTRFNKRDPSVAPEDLTTGPRAVGGYATVNTQNSALLARYAPYWWAPKWCGRHWDIVAGLVVQALIKQVGGGLVTYGEPFTHSVRNPHDTMADIGAETIGAATVEELALILPTTPLSPKPATVHSAYERLASYIRLVGHANRYTFHLGEALKEWAYYLRRRGLSNETEL